MVHFKNSKEMLIDRFDRSVYNTSDRSKDQVMEF